MVDDGDKNHGPDWLLSLPVRSKEVGFSPDEMIACEECGKRNPPNRSACLYCAGALSGAGISKSEVRVPDDWESGFNVIVVDAGAGETRRASVYLASLLGTKPDIAADILMAGKALPLCRVESEDQATLILETLSEFGIRTRIIPDDSLMAASLPTRLKTTVFAGNQLELVSFGGDRLSLESGDLMLIVTGGIREDRIESVEKQKFFTKKTLSETQTTSDTPVIDLYASGDPTGWRIPSTGFDFSCLEAEKSLLVSENIKRLILKLVEFSPSAKLVDDYAQVRSMLETAWPSGTSQDKNIGRRKHVSNVFTRNNTTQLTRYSRLQWRLYEKEV